MTEEEKVALFDKMTITEEGKEYLEVFEFVNSQGSLELYDLRH